MTTKPATYHQAEVRESAMALDGAFRTHIACVGGSASSLVIEDTRDYVLRMIARMRMLLDAAEADLRVEIVEQ